MGIEVETKATNAPSVTTPGQKVSQRSPARLPVRRGLRNCVP
jgi:hypothetical protein